MVLPLRRAGASTNGDHSCVPGMPLMRAPSLIGRSMSASATIPAAGTTVVNPANDPATDDILVLGVRLRVFF